MKNDRNLFSPIITICLLVNILLASKADFRTTLTGFLLSKKEENIVFILYTWVFVGVLMYMLKQRQQFWFGIFECLLVLIIGTFSFAYAVEKGVVAGILVLSTGIFSFVRGIGNISEGSKKNWAGSGIKILKNTPYK